jgi:MFS family permease
VPGTVLLDDEVAHADYTGGLKHGTGRDAHIVLSPQPSEDPNDPLNWCAPATADSEHSILTDHRRPLWKKEVIIAILSLGAMLHAGTNGPFLNASYFEMSQRLNMDINTVVMVSGYNLLAAGCIGPFVAAFGRKYGKRPVFLVSCLFDIVGTAVGEAQISYNYLLAARIIQGFSTSAFESLIIATVGDIYFVHQRGFRISIINFVLNSASSLASVICGQVFQNLGWLWLFHLYQIFIVIHFILMVLFVPETTYIRDSRYNIDETKEEKLAELAKLEQQHAEKVEAARDSSHPGIPAKKTFVQELAVWTGTYSDDSIFKFLVGPFLTLLNPAACYAVIASGLLNSWYVGSAIILAGIFSGPPWLFNASQIGYVGFGPFIGGMIGSIITAVMGDWVIKYMSRKNNGV